MTDLSIQDEGSIYLLRPHSEAGKAWIAEHIPEDAPRFGGAVAIEHRYIADVTQGAINDGLQFGPRDPAPPTPPEDPEGEEDDDEDDDEDDGEDDEDDDDLEQNR